MTTTEIFSCTTCGKTFTERRRHTQHIKTHSKPFRCNVCPKKFGSRPDLNRHRNATHLIGQTRFPCRFGGCGFLSNRKDNLRQHIRKQHPNASSEKKSTSLPIREGQQNLDVVVTPDIRSGNDIESFRLACDSFMVAASGGNIPMLGQLLVAGIHVDVPADDGFSALHCAARTGQIQVIEYLLKSGASIDVVNQKKKRRRPLHEAIIGHNIDAALVLIKSGADIATPDESRKSIWHYVAGTNEIKMASSLLLQVMDETGRSQSAQILFESAAREGAAKILSWISTEYPACRPRWRPHAQSSLSLAAHRGHSEVLGLLLPYVVRSEVNSYSISRVINSALEGAVKSNHAISVEKLLMRSKAQAIGDIGLLDCSALYQAAHRGYVAITRLLLSHDGVNANAYDHWWNRRPALHAAASAGHRQIVRELLSAKDIQPTCKDRMDRTPLDAAFFDLKFKICTLLLPYEDIETVIQGEDEALDTCQTLLDVNIELVKVMISRHDPLRDASKWEKIIQEMVKTSTMRCFQLLLEHGRTDQSENQNYRRQLNDFLLRSAARYNHREILQLVLSDSGTDINFFGWWSIDGNALHCAVRHRSLDCAKLLLAHKDIDTTIRDEHFWYKTGRTPLELAIHLNHQEMIDLLTEHEARNPRPTPDLSSANPNPTTTIVNYPPNPLPKNAQSHHDAAHEGQQSLMSYDDANAELFDILGAEDTDTDTDTDMEDDDE